MDSVNERVRRDNEGLNGPLFDKIRNLARQHVSAEKEELNFKKPAHERMGVADRIEREFRDIMDANGNIGNKLYAEWMRERNKFKGELAD